MKKGQLKYIFLSLVLFLSVFPFFSYCQLPPEEYLPYDGDFMFNDMKIEGRMWDFDEDWRPDNIAIEEISIHIGSLFDTPESGYRYIFHIDSEGISIVTNGDEYLFTSMLFRGNTFTFFHNGNRYILTERTSENDLKEILPGTVSFDDEQEGGTTYYYPADEYGINNWFFNFKDGELRKMHFFWLPN